MRTTPPKKTSVRLLADRNGHLTESASAQDRFLQFLYTHAAGRLFLKPLVHPLFSRIGGRFLNSRLSAVFIRPFIRTAHIDMTQYEARNYRSYNDFFTRRLRSGMRSIDSVPSHFISPCDCRLSVYPIEENGFVTIKHTHYTAGRLLHDPGLAQKFLGGTLWLCRLTVEDYHRYIYIDAGRQSGIRRIPGLLHTVNPAANDVCPIYKENAREYSLLHSEHFGTVLMMEVGALLVGQIENQPGGRTVKRGEEKGHFAFGGSTILLMTQKNRVLPDQDLVDNTRHGIETRVLLGEKIGCAKNESMLYCSTMSLKGV